MAFNPPELRRGWQDVEDERRDALGTLRRAEEALEIIDRIIADIETVPIVNGTDNAAWHAEIRRILAPYSVDTPGEVYRWRRRWAHRYAKSQQTLQELRWERFGRPVTS